MNPHIDYARPRLGSKPWKCSACMCDNSVNLYRVFNLPEWVCRSCRRSFLKDNDLDFCLGDVKVNNILLIPNIMLQIGPNCFVYACCQAIRMNYLVDVAFKNKRPSLLMLKMDPYTMVEKYEEKFKVYLDMPQLPIYHKTLKVLDSFWTDGIILHDRSRHKVGDITFIDRTDFEGICKLLASGEPVVVCLQTGAGFEWLEYGEFYHSPENTCDIHSCTLKHPEYPHVRHAVVIIGARTNHLTGAKGYWVVNSWPCWCKRKVISGGHGIVRYGISLIREEDLLSNAIKFWLPGDSSSIDDPMAFVPEPLNGTINIHNYNLFHGI